MVFDKPIQMYIFEGNANGRIMCELSNWNGRAYKISRTEITRFAERNDAENTGVYFLFGKNENNQDTVYIGEAEKILTRLKQHLNEDNWNDCIAVISKDNFLNKAHIKYLENKFYNMAKTAGRAIIQNNTVPTLSSVSEYDEAMLGEFLNNSKLLVNTLGYKTFDSITDSVIKDKNNNVVFYIKAARGADGKGYPVADGFVVEKGSVAASNITQSMSDNLKKHRNDLYNNGIINNNNIFTKDHIFTSPSLAAAIIMGRNANGRTEWKTESGETYKDIEEKQSNTVTNK